MKEDINEKINEAYKKVLNPKIDEGLPMKYGGVHLNDDILSGITVDDLQTALVSNLSSDTLDVKSATKEFNEMLNQNIMDAKRIGKKVIADMAKSLPKYMKS